MWRPDPSARAPATAAITMFGANAGQKMYEAMDLVSRASKEFEGISQNELAAVTMITAAVDEHGMDMDKAMRIVGAAKEMLDEGVDPNQVYGAVSAAAESGELSIGMGVRVVANHPTLSSERAYTIVGEFPDCSGYRVDATPHNAKSFKEQRTVTLRMDEIDGFYFVSGINVSNRVWMSTNFSHALRSEGFDPREVRIVREWPQPRGFPVRDPFEALPRLADKLTEEEEDSDDEWDTVSGWIIVFAADPSGIAEANAELAKHYNGEDRFKSSIYALQTCLLRSPTGELFDFGSQGGGRPAGTLGPGTFAYKVFMQDATQDCFQALNMHMNMGMMNLPWIDVDMNRTTHVIPFRHDSGLNPKSEVDRAMHKYTCSHDNTMRPIDSDHSMTNDLFITRKAAHAWYKAYLLSTGGAGRPNHMPGMGTMMFTHFDPSGKPLVPLFKCDGCGIIADERRSCGKCGQVLYCS